MLSTKRSPRKAAIISSGNTLFKPGAARGAAKHLSAKYAPGSIASGKFLRRYESRFKSGSGCKCLRSFFKLVQSYPCCRDSGMASDTPMQAGIRRHPVQVVTNHIARLARQLNAKALDRLALVASLLLVLLLAHALARLTWVILPAPGQALPPPPAAAPATQARADYRQIAALHLFGQAVQTSAPGEAPIDAPETRLNLTLRGILFNTLPELTRAIISAPGRDDEIYRTGAQVPGGAVIEQIYADRVMLLRNGQFETLRLPEESAIAPRGAAAPGQARSRSRVAAGAAGGLAGVRQDIVANPQNVANYIQGEPVNRAGGGIVGFRVFPGQNRAVFEQSDLREGDIITNVNGIPLDGLDKAAEAMAQLASANAVTVTVLRDGAEHTLQIQLQN